jgi:hypothetical protein
MDVKELCEIANAIEDVPNLTLSQRFIFCQIPINLGLN